MNEGKIVKYKQKMENLFKVNQYSMIEKTKDGVAGLLDMDLKNNKITEEEFDILNEFLDSLVQKYIDVLQEKEEKENIESKEEEKSFKEKYKVPDGITMYKGEWRENAPERKKDNEENDLEKE